MICYSCRRKLHDDCKGESWCDCQHRESSTGDGGRELTVHYRDLFIFTEFLGPVPVIAADIEFGEESADEINGQASDFSAGWDAIRRSWTD